MDIDIVYTWVNSKDSAWHDKRMALAKKEVNEDFSYRAGKARFQDNNELKYSLRSLKNLPFIRKVFIAHAGAAPEWLKKDSPDLVFVQQDSLIPKRFSPSYQSDVVESFLYKIPGLSEHYIYANDDNFFSGKYKRSDLFDSEDRAIVAVMPRLAGQGLKNGSVYREMELNSARALKKHLKMKKPVTYSRYPWIPVSLRCYLKGNMPINTMRHVAQPFRKSIWEEFHNVFSEEIETLCSSRFRSKNGFAINMMAHNYALSVNKAVFDFSEKNDYVGRATTTMQERAEFRKEIFENAQNVKSFCLNDEPSAGDDGWDDYVMDILNTFYPKPSRWEITKSQTDYSENLISAKSS